MSTGRVIVYELQSNTINNPTTLGDLLEQVIRRSFVMVICAVLQSPDDLSLRGVEALRLSQVCVMTAVGHMPTTVRSRPSVVGPNVSSFAVIKTTEIAMIV